jgi:hypothetical protein
LARLPVVLEAYRGEFLMKTRESKIGECKIGERKISARKISERWMTVALAIGGGFFGAMLWAQLFAPRSVVAAEAQQSRTINAERIIVQEVQLVDPSGRQRAVLNVTPDDLARLSFLTTSGKRRLAMGVLADGESAVGLYDAQGRVRIGLNVPLDDSASVHLVDKTGRNRANFVQLPNGKSSFEIFNEDGHLVWSAPTGGAANSASTQDPGEPDRQASR